MAYSGFDSFLERCHKDGDEFLNYVVQVKGDETCFLFVNDKTEEQPKQWIHIHKSSRKV
jgi:hypothetical protein